MSVIKCPKLSLNLAVHHVVCCIPNPDDWKAKSLFEIRNYKLEAIDVRSHQLWLLTNSIFIGCSVAWEHIRSVFMDHLHVQCTTNFHTTTGFPHHLYKIFSSLSASLGAKTHFHSDGEQVFNVNVYIHGSRVIHIKGP